MSLLTLLGPGVAASFYSELFILILLGVWYQGTLASEDKGDGYEHAIHI